MNYKELFTNCKTGFDFEDNIVTIFNTLGFKTTKTGSNDGGVDIIVEGTIDETYRKFYIQCKFYNRPIGKNPMQEIYAGVHYYDNDGTPVVVTNNHVTVEARLYANKLGVEIISDTEWTEFKKAINGELTDPLQRTGLFGVMLGQVIMDTNYISKAVSDAPAVEIVPDKEKMKLQLQSDFDEAEECVKEAAYLQEQAAKYSQRALRIQKKALLYTLEHG